MIPRVPNIQGLLAFEALACHRNVTQVADELHITPSAISHRIRQIETQLKFKLFVRKDFSLTPEGEAYLKRVREALAILQVAEPLGPQSTHITAHCRHADLFPAGADAASAFVSLCLSGN